MKVSVIVGGRFFAFDIARELQRRDALAGVVTQYARAPREGIRSALLRWNVALEIQSRLRHRFGHTPATRLSYEIDVAFGRWAARNLPDADVHQLWTGYALESIPVARKRGALAVAFRASAHIRTQTRLVAEEFARYGLDATGVAAPEMIERESEEYASADYVNVASTFAYETFLAEGHPRERLILTPIGVDIGEVTGTAKTRHSAGALRVLFLGTVCLRKGVHYLLDAARQLGPSKVQLSLIGGVAPDGEVLLKRHATGSERMGKVDRTGLADLFAEHDVLVLPSVEDGFGMVICEAMAAGLPVIASRHTGGPDVIAEGETGFIVPACDVSALATALAILADDRDRCVRMGDAAAQTMRQSRSWSHFADDMLGQYAVALGHGKWAAK
jgi:alpha-maltose-1-phosphate synthase